MRQAYISRGSVQIESWPLYPSLTVVNETVAASDTSNGSLSAGPIVGETVAASDTSSATLFAASSGATFEYRTRGAIRAISWNSDGAPDDGARDGTISETVSAFDTSSVSGVWAGIVSESTAGLDNVSAITNFTTLFVESSAISSAQSCVVQGGPAPTYTISNATQIGNTVTFTITLSGPSNSVITMNCRTINGTKTAGVHFAGITLPGVGGVPITFNPGETVKQVVVDVL